jgi:two-component system chemotaxis sensor kinase CheA
MSQEFMDPEIFADFIVEAKEHLETIEPNLLELEQSPENLDLLNDIFRPMHSLKGASGFLGLNKINSSPPRENIMDERAGAAWPDLGMMDVILSSTTCCGTMIENLGTECGEGEVDTETHIASLDALLAAKAPRTRPPHPGRRPPHPRQGGPGAAPAPKGLRHPARA